MRYDYMARIGILLIAFFVILVIISSIMGMVNKAKTGSGSSYFGINPSGGGVNRYKWMAVGVIMFIFIAAMAYFVFFIGGKHHPKF